MTELGVKLGQGYFFAKPSKEPDYVPPALAKEK